MISKRKMKKKIMILGASILQIPAILKALEMGLDVVAVDMNLNAEGFKIKGITKEIISTIDKELVYEAAVRNNIDGIITLASDLPMRTVSYVANRMNLVGINEDTAMKTTSKKLMRETLLKHEIAIPEFGIASSLDDAIHLLNQFNNSNNKYIFKPVDSSGSRGVYLLETTTIEECKKAFEYSVYFSKTQKVIIEEYMEGKEVSVETFAIKGDCHVIQITDKLTTGAPNFVEMGHSQPSNLPSATQQQIIELAKEANKALGINNGPSHTEIIVTDQGPKIVEIGARLGGDNITTHLVPLSTGVDMVEASIKLAIGEPVNITKTINLASAVRYFNTTEGEIKKISGVSEAESLDGVLEVKLLNKVGDQISKIQNSTDRVGFVICQKNTSDEAKSICEKACQYVQIEVK
ncbi:ATP-grasp domain-containing protein [Facklamia sp. P12955]|uniref:ATP-grasp domain-containing protein n=1 Tax=Facklamia sp. P12955 TaxID=3421946 RepID=UPI003D17D470